MKFLRFVVYVFCLGLMPVMAQTTKDSSDITVAFIEQMPEFVGGNAEMYKYISKQIVYPKIDMENNVSGRVVVQFMVDTLGIMHDAVVVRSVSPTIDAEALRVITNMPQWKPATQQGKPVNVMLSLPINFSLQKQSYSNNGIEIIGIIVGGLLGAALGIWLYSLL